MLPDFSYSLKTKIFFGPSQGVKLFQDVEESTIPWRKIPWHKCGVIILHGIEQHHLSAFRNTVQALVESTIDRKAKTLLIGTKPVDEDLSTLSNTIASLPFEQITIVSVGGHEVMVRSQHLLYRLSNTDNTKQLFFVTVPTSLGLPCFINSDLLIVDHSQRLGRITGSDVAIADAVWFNPTFTLKSQVDIDSIALLGAVLSPFTTSSSRALPEGSTTPYHKMSFSTYWYYLPQILTCIEMAHETPEDYEIRASFIWNSVIASLPVMYPMDQIPSGGAIKEATRICSVLFPEISSTRIQAEVTYGLFNHLLSDKATEVFGSLHSDLSALLGNYWADPLLHWNNKLNDLIGPLELPNAISRLIVDTDWYTKEERSYSVALWNLINSVRITTESGTSLSSPEIYAQTSTLLSSLVVSVHQDG